MRSPTTALAVGLGAMSIASLLGVLVGALGAGTRWPMWLRQVLSIAALATTIPILLVPASHEVVAAAVAPAMILAFCGYAMARSTKRSVVWSVVIGLVIVVLGVAIAVVKAAISGH